MELINLILSFIKNNFNENTLSAALSFFEKNGYDFNRIMQNFNLNSVLSSLSGLFSGFNGNEKGSENISEPNGLNPIASIADKDIIFTLNKYFSTK